MKKLLTLWLLLCRGEKEEKDERIRTQMQDSRAAVLTFACAVLLGAVVLYLKEDTMNKSQLAVCLTGAVFLLAGGLCLSYSLKGMLPAAGAFGGRDILLAGMAAAGLHWGMFVPIRQYFGKGLFFADSMLVGMLAFYLLCNGAYCAWESLQEKKDTEETEDGICRAEQAYRRKRGILWILFVILILVPGVLQYQTFSDKMMESAKELQEARIREAATPEYEQFAEVYRHWEAENEGTFVRVYKTRLVPMFREEYHPVYEEGYCLYLKTPKDRMRIAFVVEEGIPRLIQGNYYIEGEEDPERAEYLYVDGRWERMEEVHIAARKGVSGYEDIDMRLNAYDLLFTDIEETVSPLWMKDPVTVTEEEGFIRYAYSFSGQRLEEQDCALQHLAGIDSRTKEKTIELLTAPDGEIREFVRCQERSSFPRRPSGYGRHYRRKEEKACWKS